MRIKCPNCGYHLERDLKYIPFGGHCPNCGVHLVMTRKAKAILVISTLSVMFIVPSIFKGENIGRLMIWVSMGVVLVLPILLNCIFGFKTIKNFDNEETDSNLGHIKNMDLEHYSRGLDIDQPIKRFPYKLANIATIFSLMLSTLIVGLFVTSEILPESAFTSIIASLFGNIFMMLLLSIFLILGESKYLFNIISFKENRFKRIMVWFGFSYIITSFFFNGLVNVILAVDTIALMIATTSLFLLNKSNHKV